MIAEFDNEGNLPPGIHQTTWKEISERFGTNYYRKKILAGLKRALYDLESCGCKKAFLDGSFITLKNRPGDFDGCWDPHGVDLERLDPVLKDFSNGRKAQKAKYNGEFFPSTQTDPSGTVLNFFSARQRIGTSKGIISIDLGEFS